MDISLQRAIQILALDATLRPDWDAVVRRISRFYSKTFHTPLRDVADIPVVELFQTWFEEQYDDLSSDELARIVSEVCEEPEARVARLAAEAVREAKATDDMMTAAFAQLEKIKKSMASDGSVRHPDALGRLKNRPDARTVGELREAASEDSLGASISDILAKARPPVPREPNALSAIPDLEFSTGGDLPSDDADSFGGPGFGSGNLSNKPTP